MAHDRLIGADNPTGGAGGEGEGVVTVNNKGIPRPPPLLKQILLPIGVYNYDF